ADAGWVDAAAGKAVKVIYALLRHLPAGFEYRVVWMRRRLDEVIASQDRMLGRRGGAPPRDLPRERLLAVYAAQRAETEAWLAAPPAFRTPSLEYGAVVADPVAAARALEGFLGVALDRAAMARAVDPALHRVRCAPDG